MISLLEVRHARGLVGRLAQREGGAVHFTYSPDWLAAPGRFPISLSLPLRAEPFAAPGLAFFANLLPEADVRRQLCARLGISVDNDFALLAAIGGECAGALTLVDPEKAPARRRADYRPLSHEELQKLAANQVLPAVDGTRGVRLSLAGAQDKLPVLIDGDALLIPLGEAPSSHLLKFPSARFKHLPANEVLMTMLARELGLPVVEAELWKLRREGMCVVKRYDRVATGGGIARVHQEDLCQALGYPPLLKYEKEGGPNFQQCFEAVRGASAQPLADGQILLRWLCFNVLAFNSDGHAKNLSLLYSDGPIRLGPIYDLVCTRAYERLATQLAMGVGGEFQPTEVRRRHWERLAEGLGLGARFVVGVVEEMVERFPDATRTAAAEFRSRYGEKPALQLILPKIRKQAKRIAQHLR